MRRIITVLIFTVSFESLLYAQLPVQVFAGHESIEYNFLWFKNIDEKGKVTLFNFTFYDIDYENKADNFSEISQVATYNIDKTWGIAGGGRFSNGEFTPLVALSFQVQTENLYLNLFPSAQYAPSAEELQFTFFGLLFYTPRINKHWKMFNQLAFEPLFNKEQHQFSYQQIRIGLEYKERIQFGLGANLEQIGAGTNFTFTGNYGIFIRKDLF